MRRRRFFGHDMNTQWRKLELFNFSKKCCPNATRAASKLLCVFRHKLVGKVSDPPSRRLELPRRWLQLFFTLVAFFDGIGHSRRFGAPLDQSDSSPRADARRMGAG